MMFPKKLNPLEDFSCFSRLFSSDGLKCWTFVFMTLLRDLYTASISFESLGHENIPTFRYKPDDELLRQDISPKWTSPLK